MVTPESLSAWLKDQAWLLMIFALLAVGAFLLLKYSARRRAEALSRERAEVTEGSFVEHLAAFNFDPKITGATYRYLQEVQRVSFPILPSDMLDEDLGLGSEDVDQTVSELLIALNRHEAPGLRHQPMLTVEDLIRHLQASPRKSQVKETSSESVAA
jgi:hypothetical protein